MNQKVDNAEKKILNFLLQEKTNENESNFSNTKLSIKNENNDNINNRKNNNINLERTFICKLCGKIYSSYPALYNHRKQKHNSIKTRERGRPRKNSGETNAEKLKYNPLDSSYFLKENRIGKTNLNDFEKSINQSFNQIYSNNKKFFIKKNLIYYQNINQHPFLKQYLFDKHDLYIKIVNEKEISDNVFIDYLNKISLLVNPKYFIKIITFITLFREFINIKKKNKENNTIINNYIEYTSINSAENLPLLSNEFINDFLENDYLLFDLEKEETINLVQNFCNWLYINKFTSFKLILISQENCENKS